MLLRSVTLVAAALALVDVMPHCGGPEVVVRSPGEDCGYHGPRWRGDCRAPAACFRVDQGGALCTLPCEKDRDCAPLGAGFTCSTRGTAYERPDETSARAVCDRPTR